MVKRLRVGFDVDGVLFNFADSCRRYLVHLGMGHLWKSSENLTPYWNWYREWGWSDDDFINFCNDGADAGFIFCGPAREGAAEAVQRVKALGHEVVIITDRQFGSVPEVSHNNTKRWLYEHEIPYDELHFSADKTCVPTDMFVEDKIDNYDALHSAGTDVYLINRAWNLQDDHRVRIDDALEYAGMVEARTNGLIVL